MLVTWRTVRYSNIFLSECFFCFFFLSVRCQLHFFLVSFFFFSFVNFIFVFSPITRLKTDPSALSTSPFTKGCPLCARQRETYYFPFPSEGVSERPVKRSQNNTGAVEWAFLCGSSCCFLIAVCCSVSAQDQKETGNRAWKHMFPFFLLSYSEFTNVKVRFLTTKEETYTHKEQRRFLAHKFVEIGTTTRALICGFEYSCSALSSFFFFSHRVLFFYSPYPLSIIYFSTLFFLTTPTGD